MRWQGRRESDNVEDRRNDSPGMGGGGGRQIRLPRGKGGIILLIVVAVAGYYGYDLTALLEGGTPVTQQQQRPVNSAQDNEDAKFTKVILATTEETWGTLFQKMGKQYVPPKLVMYRNATSTSCGTGQSAMGPFYCPADQTVYIDLGIEPKVRQMQQGATQAQANQLSVKMELQADCFAGVWGHYVQQQNMLEVGDLKKALDTAEAIGDDRLQQKSQGRVVPDSFTHGTSQQRYTWFKRGFDSGNPGDCNTFASN